MMKKTILSFDANQEIMVKLANAVDLLLISLQY